ncbi:YraN family protein [Fusibacter sp. JL216-2]|uniref:YraN family protein n=1 Tax=Fusibacter sp. JL216-2 TaxID=3071453 RepID=UPI003D3306A5
MDRQKSGKHGENIACEHLTRHGLEIVETNYYTRYGEIDIVAKTDKTYHFVEVKTRLNHNYGRAAESLSPRKLKHFMKTVQSYVKRKKILKYDISIDFIAIDILNDGTIEFEWMKNITI